ncbi:Hpt domain-containing protein [uncultured Photobacterium sp.]|uniref:Hpt domain-containing protein n=1 Tax=uncultured Photobacterium sp. TaxID=173973 RepID=UPI0026289DB2|nr:Hpt domain-containing protein [uncultured Photobacterium sp.]
MAININLETLKKLADEVGADTVVILLNVFSNELEQYCQKLSSQPSINQIGDISHAIKSSAASFGADDLALMAQECEYRVRQGQDDWMIDHLPQFRQMVEGMAIEYKQLAGSDESINRTL